MRKVTAALIVLAIGGAAAPALAQTPPATIGQQYVPAPWWMRDPVIASIGQVEVELPANRAGFSASFQALDRSAAEASRQAADQVRALSQALASYGTQSVQVTTDISTQPLYEQYRNADGELVDNERADKIQRYQARAMVNVNIRDIAVLERIYATILASQPASVSSVDFFLEPENTWKANLEAEAVKDSRRRALAAAENAGATLGAVRLIDPTSRACQTDVLFGQTSYRGNDDQQTRVEEIVVTGSRVRPMTTPPAAPRPAAGQAPSEDAIAAARVALQPPLRTITDTACVVYGLN
jgi:uncharacterized protein YggE